MIPRQLLNATEGFVKDLLQDQDPSHDWYHINRVRNAALRIAKDEAKNNSSDIDFGLVELLSLLHDIADFKYGGSDESRTHIISTFLRSHSCSNELISTVVESVSKISYRKELGEQDQDQRLELKIVQDADKLDALGAIGIARCFAFAGATKGIFHDPSIPPLLDMTKEQYDRQSKGQTGTAINHFHEKLFKLKSCMKTATGARLAEERDQYMRRFLDRFVAEVEGRA